MISKRLLLKWFSKIRTTRYAARKYHILNPGLPHGDKAEFLNQKEYEQYLANYIKRLKETYVAPSPYSSGMSRTDHCINPRNEACLQTLKFHVQNFKLESAREIGRSGVNVELRPEPKEDEGSSEDGKLKDQNPRYYGGKRYMFLER